MTKTALIISSMSWFSQQMAVLLAMYSILTGWNKPVRLFSNKLSKNAQ